MPSLHVTILASFCGWVTILASFCGWVTILASFCGWVVLARLRIPLGDRFG